MIFLTDQHTLGENTGRVSTKEEVTSPVLPTSVSPQPYAGEPPPEKSA